MSTPRPFADAVLAYAQAGWPCVMPVPLEKSPPPVGYTGAEGRDTDPLQLATWAGSHATSSIALRMPDGVIGIDVDEYEKHGVWKHGQRTKEAAVDQWGYLPATWVSTARFGTHSGIAFYRVPSGRYATKLEGGDVEIIQRHHRYAVVWPSPHPDAGDIYRWYDPAGHAVEAPPKINELPWLPEAWVAGLAEGASPSPLASADHASGEALLAQLLLDDRVACADITSAAMHAVAEVTKADAGSRHDTMTGRIHQLVQLAAAGHPGAAGAFEFLRATWADLTTGEDRGEEFERMLLTSARKAVTAVGYRQVGIDPCLLFPEGVPEAQRAPVQGGPAYADDRPDATPPEPVVRLAELPAVEVIGAHAFDPRGFLDQVMAEAVLERTYPVLRFAHDVQIWLRRERVVWETTSADLAEWAVSQVAALMPIGNADAEKGSEARDQAERRKRFMSAGTSSSVAKKMRAVVAGGAHPAGLRMRDLDTEPWLLWAGGIGWDIGASLDIPKPAIIDPATPHMHSAGVAPEVRPTPLWDEFTAAVWPDPGLRSWALRVLSIAFTGYSDKALPILLGEKDRGKTQVIVLLMSVLGSYAHAADPRLLTSTDNAHASIVYALKGRRLSFIDEGPREGRLGMERLKQLTGGGDLTGNQMRANPITFGPTHTLVLTTNDEPVLTDPAVRSRVRLIPCEGDPAQVIAARARIGHTSGPAWRKEAPGVLAAMMREAAAWMTDRESAGIMAAPEAYRFRAEEIAIEQDPVGRWVSEELEQHEVGTRSRELYEAFVGWCKNGNLHPGRIPSETKWGRELTRIGYPSDHRTDGKHRKLRIRPRGGWFANQIPDGLGGKNDGFMTGSPTNPSTPPSPINTDEISPKNNPNDGLTGYSPIYAHTQAHAHAHDVQLETDPSPVNPSLPIAGQIAAKLVAARNQAMERDKAAPPAKAITDKPVTVKPKATRTKVDPEVRAAEKAEAKATARREAIDVAGGGLVTLPAVVTRDGTVQAITNDAAEIAKLLAAFGAFDEMTVDVETTGYPVGHANYALRTIQVGNEQVAIVFDADDLEQLGTAGALLSKARMLHAHSASADLVPLAVAGVLSTEVSWPLMHDTAIPALLADPQSTGSDADGLKALAYDVLGPHAATHAADEGRAALFKTGKWLKDVKVTTDIERSGWAQVDRRSVAMVRYAASDVLDTAALAKVLPPVAPELLEREHIAQRLTARVAHQGVAIDGAHVDMLLPIHQAALDQAADELRSFGVDNPGSDQQVSAVAVQMGARLPMTPGGKPSVARGALEPYRTADGPLGDFVRARLKYQHNETALGLFLAPYRELVQRGDGRARPTIYTLGADTGRMSCVRPNLQQVPREGGFRACITADPGSLLVSADFAGVELRVAAALSGDRNLMRMLAEGADVHWIAAREVYGPDATKADRYDVKRGVFGWLYGGSVPTLAAQMGCSESIAASLVDVLANLAPELVAWTQRIKSAVRNGHTQFPTYSGRVVHLPPKLPHKAPNYCIQGTARELLVDTLVRWSSSRWADAVLLPVHDEVLLVIPEAEAEQATAALVAAMETELYGVAIKAEASTPSFAWKDAA